MFIYSWNERSIGARQLARALEAKLIKHTKSHFVGHPRRVVVNWGSSELPTEVVRCTVLNSGPRVGYMTNKLKFFSLCHKVARLPPFTTDPDVVREWLEEGRYVCARTLLCASSARGLILLTSINKKIPKAPLYTKYIPKISEFRVHCVRLEKGCRIFDIQRKAARSDFGPADIDWQIRNLDGGFVFVRADFTTPKDVEVQALAAFNKTGLDFGAVDVIWNQQGKHAYVLEINTAPGLEGQTVQNYVQALRDRANSLLKD